MFHFFWVCRKLNFYDAILQSKTWNLTRTRNIGKGEAQSERRTTTSGFLPENPPCFKVWKITLETISSVYGMKLLVTSEENWHKLSARKIFRTLLKNEILFLPVQRRCVTCVILYSLDSKLIYFMQTYLIIEWMIRQVNFNAR